MAFFVRPSKYRHVYGTCAKRDVSYDNLRVSTNAWDTNMVKANPVSILWLCVCSMAITKLYNSSLFQSTGKLPVVELLLFFLTLKLVS
jgi:hypothetical protein